MTLETIKTTRLVGNLKIEETLVKQYIVDILNTYGGLHLLNADANVTYRGTLLFSY